MPSLRSEKISRIKNRHQFDCDDCHYQFSVTAGTIFHDSHLAALEVVSCGLSHGESKKGMSANQLKRSLDISYKTAWYLCHRIERLWKKLARPKLNGTVEVDETYVGGKYDKRRKRGPWEKQAVMG